MLRKWTEMSFRNKILISTLLIVFLLSGLSLLLSQYISDVSLISYELVEHSVPEFLWLSFWEKEIHLRESILEHFIERGSFDLLYELNSIEVEEHFLKGLEEVPPSLKDLQKEIERIDFIYENKVNGLLKYNNYDSAQKVIEEEILPDLLKLEKKIDQRYHETYFSLRQQSSRISQTIQDALWVVFIVSSLAILLSILLSYRISLGLTKPIDQLISKVGRISEGQYGLQIAPLKQVELQRLTTSINYMSTSLKESFDTLNKEKLFREKILAYIPIGIITVNHEKNECQVNDKAKELIGLDEEVLHQVMSGNQICPTNQEFWDWYHSEKFFETRKTVLKTKDTSYQTLVSQSPLKDQDEEIIGRIFFFIDISEIDALEKRMHRSEKLALAGELAAGSAHEIRNPLAVIHGFVQLINSSVTEEERMNYHLPLLLQELDRINKIVEDMLLLAKPGAPKLRYCMFKEEVLDKIIPLIKASCPEAVKIRVEVDPFMLFFDPEQMKQVFHNLLRNSIEALGEEGEICVYSKVDEDKAFIFIKDTGQGIPDDIRHKVFEPFISSKDTGTGLGLTIIQRIIENHEGEIELLSTNENGTTFKIMLPLNQLNNTDFRD
jgi:two-component system sensor histidine kinase AtoS